MLAACSTLAAEIPTDTVVETEVVQADVTETRLPTKTLTLEPTETLIPGPTNTFAPIFKIGVVADLTATDDFIGIDGVFEIISMTEIRVTGMLFTVIEAPGVDIRLGVDRDFSDEVSVSLRDITGKTYDYRNFTLTIPPEAFDGRRFNSIGIFCYDTGDLFDFAIFETP